MTSGPSASLVDARVEATVPGSAALSRRSVLLGGSAGIASLVLPAASAPASTSSFGAQPFTYATSDRTVAAWLPFDSGDASQYAANDGAGIEAKRIATGGLTAFLTQAGTPTSLGEDRTSVADPELSGDERTHAEASRGDDLTTAPAATGEGRSSADSVPGRCPVLRRSGPVR